MSQSKCIDPYDRFRLYWAHNQGGDNHSEQQFSLGKDPATKSDDFLEKFQKGFDPPSHFWKIMLQILYNGYGRIYARRQWPDSIS